MGQVRIVPDKPGSWVVISILAFQDLVLQELPRHHAMAIRQTLGGIGRFVPHGNPHPRRLAASLANSIWWFNRVWSDRAAGRARLGGVRGSGSGAAA